MTKNIVFLLITILIFTTPPASAQNWWWSKKKEPTPQEAPAKQKTTKRPPTTQEHIANWQKRLATPEELDKAVAKTRATDYKNARSYAEKKRAEIARAARAAKLQRAIAWEKNNAKSEKEKAAAAKPYYNQYTKETKPEPTQNTKKKRYIYKPKSTKLKKPPRIFNTID